MEHFSPPQLSCNRDGFVVIFIFALNAAHISAHIAAQNAARIAAQNAAHNSAHFAWFDSVLNDLLWCEEVNMAENTDVENTDGKAKEKFGMMYESEEEELSEENKTFYVCLL